MFKNSPIILAFLFSMFNTTVDVGSPDVYAVCKVTTADGSVHEGFVTLIAGGYNHTLPNGFYFSFDGGDNKVLSFDFDFESLKSYHDGSYESGIKSYVANNLYFMVNIRDVENLEMRYKQCLKPDTTGTYLIQTVEIERSSKILDTLPLFQNLMEGVLDYRRASLANCSIAMNDIISFEIVNEPNQKWLDIIAAAHGAFLEIDADENNSGDVIEPIWIHELENETKMMKYWKNEFSNKDYLLNGSDLLYYIRRRMY